MKKRIVLLCFTLIGTQPLRAQSLPENQPWDYATAKKVMGPGYWTLWTDAVQKKIDDDINKNRKADATLRITDVASNTPVRVEQISSQFIFGANSFNFNQLGTAERNKRYKDLFGTLFNSATISFYWKKFEMQPNRPRHREEYWDTEKYWNSVAEPKKEPHWRRPSPELIIEFCEQKGANARPYDGLGNRHWQHPEWLFDEYAPEGEKKTIRSWMTAYADDKTGSIYDKFTDEYKALSPSQIASTIPTYTSQLKQLFEKRVAELATYYGGRLHSWDIVNESATDFSAGLMVPNEAITKSTYGIMPGDYTFAGFQTAQQIFPKNVLLNINDYKNDESYVRQVKDLLKRGCEIDIMGSQMHLFNPQQCLDIAEGKEIQSPQQVWNTMKTISEGGLPIHLSEITITAPGDDAKGRAIQSVIAYNLYRLWFSIDKMMGISWWNIVDDCGAPGEPTTSGIFNRNMEPKPSYYALNQLINHEWKTNLTLQANGNPLTFRGFKGKYRVTWKDKSGAYKEVLFDLAKDGDGF